MGRKILVTESQLRYIVENIGRIDEQESNQVEQKIVSLFSSTSNQRWSEMANDEKQLAIQGVTKKIETHANNKGYSVDKALNKVSNASVRKKRESIPAQEMPKPEPNVYTAYYPDINTRNPQLDNFYLQDNAIAVSKENIASFNQLISELKSQISPDEKITRIEVLGASSTSQVPTTLGGKVDREKGNEVLARKRCEAITATLDSLIKTNFPDYKGEIIKRFDEKPNQGPAYTTKERKYFFGTGELDPSKKAEYEKMYGPYKGSYGSILIETMIIEQDPLPPLDLKMKNYKISIGFKDSGKGMKKSSKTSSKKLFRSKTGGGISFGGKQVIPRCSFL